MHENGVHRQNAFVDFIVHFKTVKLYFWHGLIPRQTFDKSSVSVVNDAKLWIRENRAATRENWIAAEDFTDHARCEIRNDFDHFMFCILNDGAALARPAGNHAPRFVHHFSLQIFVVFSDDKVEFPWRNQVDDVGELIFANAQSHPQLLFELVGMIEYRWLRCRISRVNQLAEEELIKLLVSRRVERIRDPREVDLESNPIVL